MATILQNGKAQPNIGLALSARQAAFNKLLNKHTEEFNMYLKSERVSRGLTATPTTGSDSMRKRIAELEGILADNGIAVTS